MSAGLPDVEAMLDEVAADDGVLAPSAFWTDFATRNAATLATPDGVATFKRSVNHNYFQWVVTHPKHQDFRAVLRQWARHPSPAPLSARVEDLDVGWFHDERPDELPPRWRPRGYALFVALVWELARRRAGADVAARLEEPELGRPITVRHRGQRISQDLANGLLEYAAVARHVPAERLQAPRLLEIGAGYGRLTWLWLALQPGARAVIVDIPPALALAQEYLTRLFPERTVARFRRGADPEALHAEVLASGLAFLTPNQFEALAPLGADIALNVSSLHEMLPVQVARYLELVDRHAEGGFFYTKQWRRWENPADGVVAARESYPYPDRWRPLYDRVHPVQVKFFEALFAL